MGNIWFTSDLHYGHKNLVTGTSEWENKEQCRKFDTLEAHNETIIKNINDIVQWNDTLYCLGDWSFGETDNIWKLRNRLNIRNLHLIVGNHDEKIWKNPILKTDAGFTNAHTLFSSVNQYLEVKIKGQKMFLCHYAMRAWHKGSRGAWHLYGHSHNNLPPYKRKDGKLYKCMDVGLDTHPEFRPYHMDELNNIFNSNQYVDCKEDHHG